MAKGMHGVLVAYQTGMSPSAYIHTLHEGAHTVVEWRQTHEAMQSTKNTQPGTPRHAGTPTLLSPIHLASRVYPFAYQHSSNLLIAYTSHI